MQSNPYKSSADLDDDIFASDDEQVSGEKVVHKHTIDGTMCPTCNVIHGMGGIPANLPPEVKEQILNLMDNLDPSVLSRADSIFATQLPPQSKLLMDFMDFMAELDHADPHGPMIQAMAKILDDRTDGHLTRLWEFYALERHLITSHLAFKTINAHLVSATDRDAPADVTTMLTLLTELLQDRITKITELYRAKAEEVGVVPNENLITDGTHGDDMDKVTRTTLYESLGGFLDK